MCLPLLACTGWQGGGKVHSNYKIRAFPFAARAKQHCFATRQLELQEYHF